MRRRGALLLLGSGLLAGSSAALWLNGPAATVDGMPDWDAVERWLAALQAAPAPRTNAGWPLPQLLLHLAQSIEFSLDGYPEPKPAWFQVSLGRIAARSFRRLGWMRHNLDAPIPGAPALDAPSLAAAIERLGQAIDRFEAHGHNLAPHFAYGPLIRDDYRRAHLMHIAEHAPRVELG